MYRHINILLINIIGYFLQAVFRIVNKHNVQFFLFKGKKILKVNLYLFIYYIYIYTTPYNIYNITIIQYIKMLFQKKN